MKERLSCLEQIKKAELEYCENYLMTKIQDAKVLPGSEGHEQPQMPVPSDAAYNGGSSRETGEGEAADGGEAFELVRELQLWTHGMRLAFGP
ncbi:uncharacterized protein HKW66_Vig0239520 [Vigna angularis]|uniref:Uncharacterized protein n=1 Tax=Phaseolus angularis TaxID=3914 RepID=A0A8T0JHW0_PHAAN|nr:uncharacterized protein HKW66_Vig0239520 [Vigna angularis]